MAAQGDRGVPLSTLCPKFLHANSTSHTWPFSAIAELIDNAYDPDVNAKQFWIDKTMVKGQECLVFMDNGNGLDHATMHKMLSFGYSDKTAVKGKEPIGIYGNGFKSGSMRLGSDALVFSKSKTVRCVGMLSQSYLKEINAEQIIVPIVCFEQGERNGLCVKEEYNASLQDILRYSPFKTQAELLLEVNAISSSTMGSTGTRIIIWNLRRASTGTSEFDFETDRYDIRIPSVVYETIKDPEVTAYIPESVFSLRAYCSILYLKPRMQVIIRGQKVKTQLIAKSLAYIRKDHYKPNFLDKRIPITFGYNTKSKDQYGILMYHKNRLIKAYERVGCQLRANIKGVGVIGVIECNFLDPTHNKQNFNETDKYRKTINSLGTKLEEYWNEIQHKRNKEDPSNTPVEDTILRKRPDQNWAQCDDCLKWRKLPDGIDCNKLPEKWFCRLNPDPQFRSCQVEEEPEDSDNEQPYRKTYKEQEREEKKKRQKEEEDRKHQEEQLMAQLQRQNQELQQQLQQKDVVPSATPSPQRIRLVQASTISQTASSPSTSSSLPVISGVCSLSPSFMGRKRTQHTTPQITSKRQKVNGFHSRILSTSVDIHNSNDSYNTDDELFILENASTPKPQKPIFDLTKIKTEPEENNDRMPLECSSDASTNDALVKKLSGTDSLGSAAVETNTTTAPVSAMSSTTTQTEVPKVKKEEDDQHHILELMQAIAQERDSCQEQVQRLSCQLQEAQKRLNEFTQAKEIKKCSHQFSQTEEPEGGKDHKSLFEKAKQKIGQMIKDKNGSLTTTSTKPNTVQGEENDIDDIAQEVECLLQELEQRTKERDELRSQLNSLEEEKANLASLCEGLKLRLQQRENAQERNSSPRATVSSDQTHSENAEGTVASHRSLISLRQSIGRLLVTFVPALDLGQVNYECDVIDEILEQVLLNVESADDPSEDA